MSFLESFEQCISCFQTPGLPSVAAVSYTAGLGESSLPSITPFSEESNGTSETPRVVSDSVHGPGGPQLPGRLYTSEMSTSQKKTQSE